MTFLSIGCGASPTWGNGDPDAGLPVATPEEVGLSSERLERIDSAMQDYVDRDKLAGMITVVARRGKVAHFKCFGMMDREAGKLMKTDTIFRIYSMTKPVTSVAIMMLYEEGNFNLNDPVSWFIPEFRDLKVFVKETESGPELADLKHPMTIRHLLTHTSGLSYGWDENSPVDAMYREAGILNPNRPLEEMVQKLAELPLVHQPGSAWNYSVSTDVLGYLVEVISGQPFDVFLEERIFKPLGMIDTAFHVPEEKLDLFAALYGPAEGGGIEAIDAPAAIRVSKPVSFLSGGGGLVSTAADYMRFAQMLLNKGELDGVRLLGRKTVERMTMNHLSEGLHPFEMKEAGFGLGLAVITDMTMSASLTSDGVFGWAGAASTGFWVDPEEELIGLILLQFMPNHHLVRQKFRTLVYQAIVE
jgi:CubicO group peptidase (beta-lactamase class C family)